MTLPHQRYAPSRLDRRGLVESGRLDPVFSGQKMLRSGVRGSEVAMAQQALFMCGAPLPLSTSEGTRQPDGVFGNETAAATLAFQNTNALGADAIIGPKTVRALDDALARAGLAALASVAGQFLAAVRASRRLPAGAGFGAQREAAAVSRLSALLGPLDLSAWRDPQRASDAEIETAFHREAGRLNAPGNRFALADGGIVTVPVLLLALAAAAAAATAVAVQSLPKPKLPQLPTATPPEILPNLVGPVVVAATIAKLREELERWRQTAINVKEVVAHCLALAAAKSNSLCQHLAAKIVEQADFMLDRIANVFENFQGFNLDIVVNGLVAMFDEIVTLLGQLAQACDCPLFKGEN